QTRYTILTASGGVDGQVTDVTSNLAFLTPLLSYDPNNVFLTLIRNDITFASVAQTPNQRAVAAALDSSPPLKTLVRAGANMYPAVTLQAFDALSGEVHGSVQTTIIEDSRYIRQACWGACAKRPMRVTPALSPRLARAAQFWPMQILPRAAVWLIAAPIGPRRRLTNCLERL